MTLREEVLKNSGLLAEANSDFDKRKNRFEKELQNLKSQYNVKIYFGYIDDGDDDEIVIEDIKTGYAKYLNVGTEASDKLKNVPKNKAIKRVDNFITALHSLQDKYGLEFGVNPEEDDYFIVYDKNNTAYINV